LNNGKPVAPQANAANRYSEDNGEDKSEEDKSE